MGLEQRPTWLRAADTHVLLDIAAQPGAKTSGLVGLHDGALRVRIAAPALDGRGNAALCAWLAEAVGCARRDVRVERGDKSRRKQVRVDADPRVVRTALEALLQRADAARDKG